MPSLKSQVNRQRERDVIAAGGYRLPGGMLPPKQAAALRRLMARGLGKSATATLGRCAELVDELLAGFSAQHIDRILACDDAMRATGGDAPEQ